MVRKNQDKRMFSSRSYIESSGRHRKGYSAKGKFTKNSLWCIGQLEFPWLTD